MRVVFAGTPEVAVPALDALHASAHELVGVVTRPDAPSGRGRKLVASPVALRAEELGLPVLKPEHPRDPDFQAALRELAPDACPVVAYGALLPQSALDIPEHGWINLHFSILPAWRGAAPVQHSIWAGDEMTGATTFRIVKELDAGPTYGVMTERIRPTDTAGDLLARLAEGGATLLVRTLDGIEDGSLEAREQPADGVSLAPKILVDDARIDWTDPAIGVDRQVRACTPGPGAWTTWEGERFKVGRGHASPTDRERARAGRPRGHQERRPRRHRHATPSSSARSRRSARSRCGRPTGPAGVIGARGRPPRLTHTQGWGASRFNDSGASLRGRPSSRRSPVAVLEILDRRHTVAPRSYNRWLIPPAALAVHLCIGQAYATSVYKNSLIEHFDASQTAIGFVFSIAIVMLGLSAAVFGTWVEKVGPRKAMFTAACCWAAGFLVGSVGIATGQLWLLYLGYGVIGGVGLGIGYISPVSTLIKWFPDRPGPGHRHGDHGLRRRRDGRRAPLAPAAVLLRPGVRPHRRRLAGRRARADLALRHPRHRLLRDHDARRRQHPRPRAGLAPRRLRPLRRSSRRRWSPSTTSRPPTPSARRSSGCCGRCCSATSPPASASSSRPAR